MPIDTRPKIFPPPPVRLATVADARLCAIAGLEIQLDKFYVELLKFERDSSHPHIAYRAENWRLCFDSHERPRPRDDYRFVGVIVPSLSDLARRFDEAGFSYDRLRGIFAGQESLLLNDPCGNMLEITESKLIF
jgi:hypothetical protein